MSLRVRSLALGAFILAAFILSTSRGAAPPVQLLDALGDPLPPGALARYGTVRLRQAAVQNLTFTSDGKRLLSFGGNMPMEFRLWDTATGKLLQRRRFPAQDVGEMPAFGPDGSVYLAGMGAVYRIKGLDGAREKLYAQDEFQPTSAPVVSPDGKMLAVGTTDGALVLDLPAGKPRMRVELPAQPGIDGAPPGGIAFSQDGKMLAVASFGGHVALHDTGARRQIHTYKTGRELPGMMDVEFGGALHFSPDGKHILAQSAGKLLLLETTAAREAPGFRSPAEPLLSVSFSSDGKQLVGVDHQGQLRRFEAGTGKDVSTTPLPFKPREGVHQAAFSPDRRTVAVVENANIHLVDLKTGKSKHPALGSREPLRTARWSRGKEMVSLSAGNAVHFWDPRTGRRLRSVSFADEEMIFDIDRDAERTIVMAPEQPLRVLRLSDRKELWKAEEGAAFGGQFSPDGRWVVLATEAGLDVRDARTGNVRRSWKRENAEGGINASVAWSSGGRMVALADFADGRVKVYEFGTGQIRYTVNTADATTAAFCPRGLHLAAGSADGVIRVYRLGQPRPLFEVVVRGAGAGAIPIEFGPAAAKGAVVNVGEVREKLAFSPDGRMLAAACANDVRVWDMAGKPLGVFRGHEEQVTDLTFAADGRTLATASADGTALIWDIGYLQRSSVTVAERSAEETLWADLAAEDAARAFRAMTQLRDRPTAALKLLSARLSAAGAVEAKAVRKLIDDLESDAAAVRRRAAASLEALDVQAEAELTKALEATKSAEVRRAVGRLLSRLEGAVLDPDRLRDVRAVEVLETIGNAQAKAILERLAKGADARLTREAKEALARLAAKPDR